MTNINQVKAARFKESEEKRFNFEIKKLRTEHGRKYSKEVKKNEETMVRLKDDYEKKIGTMELELEQKLTDVRSRQKKSLVLENERLKEELINLKKAHGDQVGEIKETQENEIQNLVQSHKTTIENARQKYIKEQMKWNNDA
jgi:hypothetical protein